MVEVAWDEVQESIDGHDKTNVILHANKWRKACEGAWRMNINNMEDDNQNQVIMIMRIRMRMIDKNNN